LLELLRGPRFAEIVASLPGYKAPHAGEVSTIGEALKMAHLPVSA
jgi:hypothetical protein